VRLSGDQSFYDNVLDIGPDLLGTLVRGTLSVAFNIVKDCTETPLVAHVVLVGIFIEHKVIAILVYCIVGQVHAQIA